MARERYKDIRFKPETLAIIRDANRVLDEYRADGFLPLSLRQVYYRMIGLDLFPETWIDPEYNRRKNLPADTKNTEKSYKRFGSILGDARLAGLIDWSDIEDRNREPEVCSEWSSIGDLVEGALNAYRLRRWDGQPEYVECWVEKAALSGIIGPVAREFHVTLLANRGYSSISTMRESAERITSICEDEARTPTILYIGDHDPSGEDMVRDIRDRLDLFGVEGLTVEKVALTREQVEEYDPPTNPTKTTDARAKGYIAEHGDHSWEVEALPPRVLVQLLRTVLKRHVNSKKMKAIIARETRDKARLREAAREIMES